MIKYGLIGFPLGHSFSKKYFTDKFESMGLPDHQYELYPIESVDELKKLISREPDLKGLNVTIPHKTAVIPLLDRLDESAAEIGAVNVIRIERSANGEEALIGFNSDEYGFRSSLQPLLSTVHTHALILGTGGAAKAVAFSLKQSGIAFKYVSRKPYPDGLTYDELDKEIINRYKLIINCSPVGTFPNTDACPNIPYEALSPNHLLYDLVYNPEETLFMKKGREKGALAKNGLEMLQLQAERAWGIWTINP